MSDLFSSSIAKDGFSRGVLCECGHKRVQHRLIHTWISDENDENDLYEGIGNVSCVCKCNLFVKITNLKYLEILQKTSENFK